jgi:hypothetical protein
MRGKANTTPDRSPRNVGLADAAAYVGLPTAEFLRRVSIGELPAAAFTWGRGRAVWDLRHIDRVLDQRSGIDQSRKSFNDVGATADVDEFLEALR